MNYREEVWNNLTNVVRLIILHDIFTSLLQHRLCRYRRNAARTRSRVAPFANCNVPSQFFVSDFQFL